MVPPSSASPRRSGPTAQCTSPSAATADPAAPRGVSNHVAWGGCRLVEPSVEPAEQQEQHHDNQDQPQPAAVVAATIVAGAIAVVAAAPEQEQHDQKDEEERHDPYLCLQCLRI